MAANNNVINLVRSYAYHLVYTAWKRRLGTILCVAFFIICLLYIHFGTGYRHEDQLIEEQQLHSINRLANSITGARRTFRTPESSKPNPDYLLPESSKVVGNGEVVQTSEAYNLEQRMVDLVQKNVPYFRSVVKDYQPNFGGYGQDFLARYNQAKGPVFVPNRRLVHFDLKGAPPKLNYYKKVFAILKRLGATGLLLEYEDMFPYSGALSSVPARNHYTAQDIKQILKMAADFNFEIIPLVQTFGHMEFVLKLEKFSHLREVSGIPQAICPSKNESLRLVEQMIDQVMDMHKGYKIKWLHIGCDEVFQLASCSVCAVKGRTDIFLHHVEHVARYVRDRHGVIPIIWDDMLHHFSAEQLKQYKLGELVEPMLWTYVDDVYRFISPGIFLTYSEVFPYIWTASAYKGAFGETLMVPSVKKHLENNLAWLEVMSIEHHRFKEIRGIALTGWQRYDHFAVLCELLPSSIPSLAVSLLTTSKGYFNRTWMGQLYDGLQCMKSPKYTTFLNLDSDPMLYDKMSYCFFPGVTFFKLTERVLSVRKEIDEFIRAETLNRAWLTEYNVRHNFSSHSRIDNALADYIRHVYHVETVIRQAKDALREVYDEYTVAEWIEQNLYPVLRKLELLRQTGESLKKASTWPVRPFEPLPELRKYDIGIPAD